MNAYKQAAKIGLTFESSRGNLSVSQLFQMPLTGNNGFNLDEVSKTLLRKIRETDEESLVSEPSEVNTLDTLRKEILTDIITDKKAEKVAKETALANETKNAKIDAIIARKKEAELENMSVEDLEKLKA